MIGFAKVRKLAHLGAKWGFEGTMEGFFAILVNSALFFIYGMENWCHLSTYTVCFARVQEWAILGQNGKFRGQNRGLWLRITGGI